MALFFFYHLLIFLLNRLPLRQYSNELVPVYCGLTFWPHTRPDVHPTSISTDILHRPTFFFFFLATKIFMAFYCKKTTTCYFINSWGFTFFTSAKRSFFLTGLFLTSDVCCCDLDSADSLSDSEWLSDSEELFDSELCDLPLSLPWSLSDWLPDSDTEWLDSSEAELLQEQEHVQSYCCISVQNSGKYVQRKGKKALVSWWSWK